MEGTELMKDFSDVRIFLCTTPTRMNYSFGRTSLRVLVERWFTIRAAIGTARSMPEQSVETGWILRRSC
jgi:hypothetical protein